MGGGQNWEVLAQQVETHTPEIVGVQDQSTQTTLEKTLQSREIRNSSLPEIVVGEEGIRKLAAYPDSDIVLSAISGSDGLPGTIEAIQHGKDVALANKESMVVGGPVIRRLLSGSGAEILPVDSEHSSIFQLLNHTEARDVNNVVLTASGGPFWHSSKEEMAEASPEEALDHPNWDMGKKITIDSATMMNKALEVVEAHYLFDLPAEQIDVLVHPQSIVHAFVTLRDGSLFAHMGEADMKNPIQYALTYPERRESSVSTLKLEEVGTLSFSEPDYERFPALKLGYKAIRRGGTAGSVLNAANELAVSAFLSGDLSFLNITQIVRNVMQKHEVVDNPSLEQIKSADSWARKQAESVISSLAT